MTVEAQSIERAFLDREARRCLRICWDPHTEHCGLILKNQVVYPLRNVSDQPDCSFEFCEDELKELYQKGQDFQALGVYHTHPRNSPRPSTSDIAGWPKRHGIHYWIITREAAWEWAKNNDGTAYLVCKTSLAS